MSAKTVRITLEVDDKGNAKIIKGAKKVESAVTAANRAAAASYQKFSRQVGKTLDNMFKKVVRFGALIGGALIVGGISKMIAIGAKFEQAMQDMRAVLAPTSKEFKNLSDTARELGRTTVFSAQEAAMGMRNLALAGFNAAEITATIGPALSLAAAGGLDMAEAARITANVIRGMGLAVEDFTTASNALVFAATNSNQTISDMGHAFKFIGPVANAIKADITELSAALGVLANVGLRGEMAGTGLRRSMTVFLTEMANGDEVVGKMNLQLEKNADGFFSLADAIQAMADKSISAAEIMKAFGQRAGPAMLALTQIGAEGIKRFQREIIELGEQSRNLAQEIANIKLDTVIGDFTLLKSKASEVSIAFFQEVAPAIREVVQSLGTVLVGEDGKGGIAAWFKTADVIGIIKDAFKALKIIIKSLVAVRITLFFVSLGKAAAVAGAQATIAASGIGAFAAATNLIPFVAIITALGFIAMGLLDIGKNATAAEGSLRWLSDDRFKKMRDSVDESIAKVKEFKDELPIDVTIDEVTGVENFTEVRQELGRVQSRMASIKNDLEAWTAWDTFWDGTLAFDALNEELVELAMREKVLRKGFVDGADSMENISVKSELLKKNMAQASDVLEKYSDDWIEFSQGGTGSFVGPLQATERINLELATFDAWLKKITQDAKTEADALQELSKEQLKMAGSLKKALVDSGIGHALAAAEVVVYLEALEAVADVKELGVNRTQIIEANAEAWKKELMAAQAFGVELDKLELEVLDIAVNFVVSKQDEKTPGFADAFATSLEGLELELGGTETESEKIQKAWKLASQFVKDSAAGVALMTAETKRLDDVAKEVNQSFVNLIDPDPLAAAAEEISNTFTEKMIQNMDAETYAQLFRDTVQAHFEGQPVGLITPEMYEPQLQAYNEAFAAAMKGGETSVEEFALAWEEQILEMVALMEAAGEDIPDVMEEMFEFLRENRIKLYNEEQLENDLLRMAEFKEQWSQNWSSLVDTQTTAMLQMGLQAIATGQSLSDSFKKWKQSAIQQFTSLLAKWITERIKIFILEKAMSNATKTSEFSSGQALVYQATFASIASIPWIGPALAPGAAAAAVALVAGIGGAFLAAGKAAGGLITGPGGPTSDSILTPLSDGEFVIKASSVRRLGSGFLDVLNQRPDTVFGGTGAGVPAAVGGGGGQMVTNVLQVTIAQTFPGDNWSENGIKDELREVVIEATREAIEDGTELEFPTEVR